MKKAYGEGMTLEATQSTGSSADETKKETMEEVPQETAETDGAPAPDNPEGPQVVVPGTWVLHDREGNGHKVRVPKGSSPEAHALWEEALWELTNPDEIRPLIAWFESDMAVLDSRGLPSVPDFEERYRGTWESFSAFAQDFVNNSDLLRGVDEGLVPYFSWTMWAQDLEHDYTVVPAMGYENGTTTDVYVFADL